MSNILQEYNNSFWANDFVATICGLAIKVDKNKHCFL